MVDFVQFIVRYVHLLSGVMWVGGFALWGMLVNPSLRRRLPEAAKTAFTRGVLSRFARYSAIAGVVTILTGVINMGMIYPHAEGEGYFAMFGPESGAWGMTLGAAFFLSLGMLGLTVWLVRASQGLEAMSTDPAAVKSGERRVTMLLMLNMAVGFVVLGLMGWAVSLRVG